MLLQFWQEFILGFEKTIQRKVLVFSIIIQIKEKSS